MWTKVWLYIRKGMNSGQSVTLSCLAAGAVNSLGVVLGQEMQRYNSLLACMATSLHLLSKALQVRSHVSLHCLYTNTWLCYLGVKQQLHSAALSCLV